MKTEIARGAEAIICLENETNEYEQKQVLIKDRVKKGYRLPELDNRIRRQRTKRENSLLDRARRAGVSTPRVFDVSENELVMEFVDGDKVKDVFNEMDDDKRNETAGLIGEVLGKLHSASIMHGDFTTSNMILKHDRRLKGNERGRPTMKLFIIDLGLGKFTQKAEDQAVDLYLLHEALKATHFKYLNEAWQKILKSYGQQYTQAQAVLKRLEKIEKRRRYKHG